MKKFLFIMLATATLAIFGCSSTNSGGYFGYNNKPDYPDTKPAVQNQPSAVTGNSDAGWVNPMDQSNNSIRKLDYVYADYSYQYNPYIYVPVIVPWWNNYHGWVSYPFPGSHFSVYYSNFWGCNWYSPWYVYHPYYGGYWGSHYADGYHHWYHQPVYTHNTRPVDKSTYRSFGENRGTYSNNRVRSTAASSSDRYRTGAEGYVPGRVESSSQRGSANSAASTGNTYRSTSNTGSSRSNSAVTGGTSSSRNEVKTFKPFDISSFGSSSTRTNATSTPSRQGSSAESSNTYRTNNNNSSSSERSSGSSSSSSRGSSASTESERSSSSSSRPSVEPSAPSSTSGSSSSSERSSGSSSGSSSSSSGRGSSSGSGSGSGSGRTR